MAPSVILSAVVFGIIHVSLKDALLLAISEEYVGGVELLLQVGTQSGVQIGRANRPHSRLRLCY